MPRDPKRRETPWRRDRQRDLRRAERDVEATALAVASGETVGEIRPLWKKIAGSCLLMWPGLQGCGSAQAVAGSTRDAPDQWLKTCVRLALVKGVG